MCLLFVNLGDLSLLFFFFFLALCLAFIFPCFASLKETAIQWSNAEVGAGQRGRLRTLGLIAYARREGAPGAEQGHAAAFKRSPSRKSSKYKSLP